MIVACANAARTLAFTARAGALRSVSIAAARAAMRMPRRCAGTRARRPRAEGRCDDRTREPGAHHGRPEQQRDALHCEPGRPLAPPAACAPARYHQVEDRGVRASARACEVDASRPFCRLAVRAGGLSWLSRRAPDVTGTFRASRVSSSRTRTPRSRSSRSRSALTTCSSPPPTSPGGRPTREAAAARARPRARATPRQTRAHRPAPPQLLREQRASAPHAHVGAPVGSHARGQGGVPVHGRRVPARRDRRVAFPGVPPGAHARARRAKNGQRERR